MDQHYAGDDTNVRLLAGGILAAYSGITVEDFETLSDEFLRSAQHPTLGRGYFECAYAPMVELLGYLEANGFSNYIASGGGRDFMRPISQDMYRIPRERVIGSSTTSRTPATVSAAPSPTSPKPTTSTTVPRSRCASGTASAAAASRGRELERGRSRCSSSPIMPTSRRCASWCCTMMPSAEFDYVKGAESALERAKTDGWTVVSMKNDWTTVF
jgi:hypothetical protein